VVYQAKPVVMTGAILAALAVGLSPAAGPAAAKGAKTAVAACDTPTTPFCSSTVPLPPGWTGPTFVLRQDYPATAPADTRPWLAFDPKTQPSQYILAVLGYFYEGNIRPDVEKSFDPKLNTVRAWYNAPWQDFGLNGREPAHGLTRERLSRAGELAPQQTHQWNNFAVGFYNAPGAQVIGQVWKNHGAPNPAAGGSMPEGTVAAKLLFTTAPVSEVPYLQGAPTWTAYVSTGPSGKPAATQVRLLQIDVAVKDSRVASLTGWVFGTFVYGGGPGGASGSGWTNVAPVGLMWGNDPGFSGTGALTQTWLNPGVHMPHLGYQGRLNGPVDNKVSSCLSCHGTAEAPEGDMIPTKGADPARWFQNIPSGTPFDAGRQSLDYSLQMAVGLGNFHNANKVKTTKSPQAKKALLHQLLLREQRPPRDGGPTH
jgi:hypothetical protein